MHMEDTLETDMPASMLQRLAEYIYVMNWPVCAVTDVSHFPLKSATCACGGVL